MKRNMTLKRQSLAVLIAAAFMAAAPDMAWGQATKQAVWVGSSGNVTAVKDGTADAESTSGKKYVETTSGNTVTITTAAPPAGKVAKVTVSSYAVTSASEAKVPVTALTVTGTVGATDVSKGSTLQMTATAAPTYADWQAVTVTWSVASDTQSDNPGNATIDASTGMLTGTAEGDVVVTATATDVSGVTGQCTVTVVKPVPAGAIRGKFTINAGGEQVYFSQGNLQATTTDNGTNWSWDFAANQWDYVGNNAANNAINGNGIVSENGTVDLFRWVGASSTYFDDKPAAAKYGISNSWTSDNYGNATESLKSDWGTLIGTGWRTLTSAEWVWILGPNSSPNPGTNCRTSGSTVNGTGNARYTLATINTDGTGVKGVILFPDGVTIANIDGVTWGNINARSSWGTECTTAGWSALAAKGCVFLPAAGDWNTQEDTYFGGGSTAIYWSSSADYGTPGYASANTAYCMYIDSDFYEVNKKFARTYGCAVRLVKNVVGSISFATTSMVKKPGDGAFTNPLTNTGDGTVSYSRSDGDDICTVNETTGEVTLNGNLGTCTITATVADGSIYTYPTHTASYTLVVDPAPTGAIRGKFTINASGDQVYFSQGNLQAVFASAGSSCTWKFADNQWDVVGDAAANNAINGNGTVSTNGTVDLFRWVGNSTDFTTAPAIYGITNTSTWSNFGNVTSENLKSDWGTLIGEGWRTLTKDEWNYLLKTRTVNGGTGAGKCFTYGQTVNDILGLVIYPDGYTGSAYAGSDWATFEAAGCVFLPAAGYLWQNSPSPQSVNSCIFYWTATSDGSDGYSAFRLTFDNSHTSGSFDSTHRNRGNAVRLVIPVPTE